MTLKKILKIFNYFDVSLVCSPFSPSTILKKNDGENISQYKYLQIIRSLLYLINHTIPDIAYAVGWLGKYTHNPNASHWSFLEIIFEYLKGTIDYALRYTGFPA